MNFADSLNFGQIAETEIAKFLRKRGLSLLPAYEVEINSGKGPRLYYKDRQLIAPDFCCFSKIRRRIFFAEVKHKSRCTWYRKNASWQTGIDKNHFYDYLEVSKVTGCEIWLLFLHKINRPSKFDLKFGAPFICPTGLYSESIEKLNWSIDHIAPYFDKNRDGNCGHGTTGMIYWDIKKLKKIMDLNEFMLFISD